MAKTPTQYVICIDNAGREASLERRKLYATKRDNHASALGLLRVIDESGSDYLYPQSAFQAVTLSAAMRQAIHRAN